MYEISVCASTAYIIPKVPTTKNQILYFHVQMLLKPFPKPANAFLNEDKMPRLRIFLSLTGTGLTDIRSWFLFIAILK